MNYLSVFSGIEAASVAWKPLGFKPLGFSEIDPFASAVLAHHYPETKNYGDITKHKSWEIRPGTVDILIGGSPCQAFSCAGLRQGIADPRGNLTLVFVSLIERLRPSYVLWENVPGVLSSNRGADFAAFIWALGQCGYGFSWRVLDAKSTGSPKPLPQRRRRVYLVAVASGKCEDAAQILFKPQGLPGDFEKGNSQGEGIATPASQSPSASVPGSLKHFRKSSRAVSSDGYETWVESPFTNTFNLFDLGDIRSTSAVVDEAVLYENHGQDSRITPCPNIAPTVVAKYGTGGNNTPLVREIITFQPGNLCRNAGANPSSSFVTTLKASAGDQTPCIAEKRFVRRLHPIEGERLQGFPDNYTQIPWKGKPPEQCPDANRFKCIGNSMAVPVIRLLGERIKAYEEAKAKA